MSEELKLLRADLEELGATSVQRERLESDVRKARVAIAKALEAHVKHPIPYALAVFNAGGYSSAKQKTENRSVIVDCPHCNGDRLVVFSERPALNGSVEEYAPCPWCNPNANTARVRFASPSPDRVRERLARQ